MAKAPTLIDITHIPTAVPPLNTNSDRIEAAFLNTLSRDGSGPNAMGADLDLNGNDLLNGGEASFSSLVVDGSPISSYVDGAEAAAVAAEAFAEAAEDSASDAAASASLAAASEAVVLSVEDNLPDWKGAWLTATVYDLGDLVRESGSSYICVEAHTSGTFATDLTAVKWELFAQQGAAGGGTGDMLAANNLSDVANVATARANISAQANNANLTSLSGLTLAADKGLYATGASAVATYDLTAAGRALLDDADAMAQRATLGLGTMSQEDVADYLLDDADWVAGIATTPGLPTPAQVAAVLGGVEDQIVGVNQEWQDVSASRAPNTVYTNSTGRPIVAAITIKSGSSSSWNFRVGPDIVGLLPVSGSSASGVTAVSFVIPAGHVYRYGVTAGSPSVLYWAELR